MAGCVPRYLNFTFCMYQRVVVADAKFLCTSSVGLLGSNLVILWCAEFWLDSQGEYLKLSVVSDYKSIGLCIPPPPDSGHPLCGDPFLVYTGLRAKFRWKISQNEICHFWQAPMAATGPLWNIFFITECIALKLTILTGIKIWFKKNQTFSQSAQ
jgi:hypothetical protein